MVEDQIITGAIAILVAVIGWIAGACTERKRHKNDIELIILRDRMQAYNEFLGHLRSTSTYTGQIASEKNYMKDIVKCKTIQKELFSYTSRLWTLASNPLILKDNDIQKCMKSVNMATGAISVKLTSCMNGDYMAWIEIGERHSALMAAVREVESAVADKFEKKYGKSL